MSGQVFDSVWDAIEDSPAKAANMKARSELMITLREEIKGWNVTQAEAAQRIGISQPRLNDLFRGRIDKFSFDALIKLATAAGLLVKVEVVRPAA